MKQQPDQRMAREQPRVERPIRRIIQSNRLLQVCPARGKFSEMEARPPAGIAAHHSRRDVTAVLAQTSQLVGKLAGPVEVSSSPMIGPLAIQREQQRARPLQRYREL